MERSADQGPATDAGGSAPTTGVPERREPPKLVQRLKERRESYRERGRIYRSVWVLAGFTVVAAGAAMLVLPGPALVVIPIGLAMLSLEFAWAENLLEKTLEGGLAAKDIAVNASRRQQILGGAAIVTGAGAVITLSWLYVF
jgi:hypothetical protein